MGISAETPSQNMESKSRKMRDTVGRLVTFMQRNQLNTIAFDTYDRMRRIMEDDPVRAKEWLTVVSCCRSDHWLKVNHVVVNGKSETTVVLP